MRAKGAIIKLLFVNYVQCITYVRDCLTACEHGEKRVSLNRDAHFDMSSPKDLLDLESR